MSFRIQSSKPVVGTGGGGTWGTISGTLADQSDLQAELIKIDDVFQPIGAIADPAPSATAYPVVPQVLLEFRAPVLPTGATPSGGDTDVDDVPNRVTNNLGYPLNTDWIEHRTQILYPAIGLDGTLSRLSLFRHASGAAIALTSCVIRIKTTALTVFTAGGWENTGWTTVFSGDISFPADPYLAAGGMLHFDFTTPFVQDGTSALMIDISYVNAAPVTAVLTQAFDAGSNRVLFGRSSTNTAGPLTWTSGSPPEQQGLSIWVPRVRLWTQYVDADEKFIDSRGIAWMVNSTILPARPAATPLGNSGLVLLDPDASAWPGWSIYELPQIMAAGSFSIAFWVRSDDHVSNQTIIEFWDDIESSFLTVEISPTQIWFRSHAGWVDPDPAVGAVYPPAPIAGLLSDGRFHHVAIAKNGDALSYYVDGVLILAATIGAGDNVIDYTYISYAEVGYNHTNWSVRTAALVLSDIGLWPVELTAGNVTALFAMGDLAVLSQPGRVPQTTTVSDANKFLRGNGQWSAIPTFVGADGTNAGVAGLAPAPAALDNTKFLRGDGGWVAVVDDDIAPVLSVPADYPLFAYPGTTTPVLIELKTPGAVAPALVTVDIPAARLANIHDNAVPFYTLYEDSRSQIIYLQSELGAVARSFTSLKFDVTRLPGQAMAAFTVRMQHTGLSQWATTTSWLSAGWTTVFSGTITVSALGEYEIVFSTPFAYDGVSNLVIDICFNNASWSQPGWVTLFTTPGPARTLWGYADSTNGDPLTWTMTGTLNNFVPKIVLNAGVGTPTYAVGDTAGNTYDIVGDVTVSEITPLGERGAYFAVTPTSAYIEHAATPAGILAPDMYGSIAIAFWIRFEDDSSNALKVIKLFSTGGVDYLAVSINGNELQLQAGNTGWWPACMLKNPLGDSRFHHVLVTKHGGGTIEYYVDGVLVATTAGQAYFSFGTFTGVEIGRPWSDAVPRGSAVIISDIAIWTAASGRAVATDVPANLFNNPGLAQMSYAGLVPPTRVIADNAKFLRGDGTWQVVAATPAGNDTQIQFNNGGSAFGASANLTWDGTTLSATALKSTTDAEIDDAGWFYLGAPGVDGTWRLGRVSTDVVMQRRETGTYVTKHTFGA